MKRTGKRIAAAVAAGGLLMLLTVVGLGCMNVTLLRNVEGWQDELYHTAWIPWLVMGLAVIGCLALLGVLRPLKPQNPLNYAPALALGLLLCVVTGSPLVWMEFNASRWNVPYALVLVYALFAVEFVRLLRQAENRKMPFDWKRAAALVGWLALAYLPLLVSELGKAIGGAFSSIDSREPLFTANKLQLAFFFLGGAVGLLVARRGRRGAGIFLTALGVALVGLFFFTYLKDRTAPVLEELNGHELPVWISVMAARAYEGLIHYASMSAYGFVFFAGIKCLLPERRAA